MSENSLSETYLSETYGMVYFIQPGDTPEYLEDLRKRGFITVSINIDEAVEKEYANIVVTAADTTDPNNWADGPAKQVTFIDSMTDTTNCSVTINNSNTTDTTTDPNNYLEGPLPQSELEKLEKLRNAEWKLYKFTSDDFGKLIHYSESTDTTGADPAGLIAGMKSYLEEIAPKMSDIDSLTDEEVASFNETLKSFKDALRQAGVATYLADTTLDPRTDTGMNPETFDPRTDTSLNDLLDSYIAALDEKEAKTEDTTDLNNWADGPSYPVNPETKDRINGEDIVVTIIDYHHGRMLGDMDPPGRESTPPDVTTIEDLTPVLIPVSSELLQRFEEAKKIRQRLAERSNPIAFVSTLDAETEAVKSVQVACADTDGWHEIGTLNNPDGIDWKYQAGNLTGSGAASVVWHAQELGALGVWTDGTDNWTGIAGWFDANWTMLGCGDFDGDGKDSVLMSLSGGQFYSVDLDGTLTGLGGLNWSGWEFGAVGDFAGDGKDDVVLFHKELGTVVLLADGNADAWTSLGTIDSSDWAIAGVRDFDSDGIDDLLVLQDSTGLIGGYAGADMSQWSVVGNAHYLYSDTAVLA